jgi:beta-galactosidase/beta-glucuronidase
MTSAEFGFTRERDEAAALGPYLNPLPRSVVRSNTFLLLDGAWRFDLDPEDRGLRERWYLGRDYGGTARWPGSIEAQIASARAAHDSTVVGAPTAASDDEVVAWYEREFEAPGEWVAAPESAVQITFGACGYETRVWLNGVLLRTVEGEEAHVGEYTSFSYELPPEHLAPVNRITVRVADSLDPDTPRGKQESHVYKRGGIWYQAISGPVRSVWIEPVERNRLRSRLGVVSAIEDRMVEFQVTTRIRDPGRYALRLVVSLRGDDRPLATADVVLALETGETRQYLALELPEARPWAPASPTLYQLVAQLRAPGGHVSQIETHFGLRTVEARGRWFYLNGERLYLDGILYQPATATFDEMRRHMAGMRELGCNLVRVHIAGIDPRVYELADELGMLLWVEVPSPHRPTARSRDNHWAELQRLLVQVGAHPSVVILSLYNEDWGAEDIATNPETREYVARTYAHLRLHYPQFLVVDNDGWQHVSAEGRLRSDLLTVHSYQTDVDRWRDVLDRLVAGDHDAVAARPLVVGDPFYFGGQAPLVVSEWGGFGFAMYGGPAELDTRAERIRAFKRELGRRAIAGDVYTQATSVEGESNGLLDPRTGELLVPAKLLASPTTG